MDLREHAYSILIVSAAEKFNTSIKELFPDFSCSIIKVEKNVSSAKRALAEREYDIVIINSPLPDDDGIRFAIDMCSGKNTVALLLVRAELYAPIFDKVSPYGVYTLSKPISRQVLRQAFDWMAATRERLRRFEKKTLDLEDKMQEIRLINRAKWLLIDNLKMPENEAHRYIEKQAMDRCVSRKNIAEEIIKTLVTAIDAKDIYTKGHSTRVAEYSVILAKRLGWDEERVKRIRYKALLHDIGKIGIPDRVLNKADRLSDQEFEVIKSHTTIGAEMLKGVSSLSDMYLVARNHHERYDGKGYPDAESGDEIPEEARLVGLVDAYDAMSSDRAYRKALPADVIRNELLRGRGTQFDPEMTSVFLEIWDEGAFVLDKSENESHDYTNDVLRIVTNILNESYEPGALKMDVESMANVYQYISGMHERYGIDFSTLLISLEWENDVPMSDVSDAMKALEYSILQSLRKVDVMSRVSESQYLIVLTEAHSQNIQMIIERVFASFFKNCQNTKIKPVYEIK